MSRCDHHRLSEPCYYCERGIQPFVTATDYQDALEERLRVMTRKIQVAALDQMVAEPDGIDLKEAVAVIRDYALGDLVMLSPSLKRLKEKDPKRPLVLVTDPGLFDVLDGADYLDAILPKQGHEFARFHKSYNLVGAVETECGGKLPVKKYLSTPRPDIFAELLGVEGGAEHFPLPVNLEALKRMKAAIAGAKGPIIGLACTCHSAVRVMPPEYVEPLTKKLLKSHGGTVVLIGKTETWNRELANIEMPNVINLIDALNIKELIALCSLMNAMISPDTGSMHIAGALGVRCLAVIGNNNPRNFSDFYPSVKVLQPTSKELPCVPCNDRSIPCLPLPEGQYGAKCMRASTPDKIVSAFKECYNGKNIAYLHDTSLEFIGGAEITTKGMVKAGLNLGYNVRVFDNSTPMEELKEISGYDLIILSNIWRFSDEAMAIIMDAIRHVPFVKYDHDHDSLEAKALGKWPKAEYAAKIFKKSALNIFVSPAHQADYKGMATGICIPELIDVAMFKPVPGVERQPESVLVVVPGKWDSEVLKRYIKAHPQLKVDVLDKKVPHDQMPALYSQYEYIAHFPQRKWPCDRVIYEAALCGCKVEAGDIVEAVSWDKDLGDAKALRSWLSAVPGQFWGEVAKVLEGVKRG